MIWNRDVESNIRKLRPVKQWLNRFIAHKQTDWESQKSAHQALKLLEMAEYEMWNMQWWQDRNERGLYLKAEKTV